MKKHIRIVILVALATLLLSTVGALALSNGVVGGNTTAPIPQPENIVGGTIDPTPEVKETIEYTSTTGTIKEIRPFYGQDGVTPVEGKYFVLIEDENGSQTNLIVDTDTVRMTENELKVGATITGYYKANQPMLMIYPPQIYADVIAVDLEAGETVVVNYFDENMVSADGSLKLNVDVTTKVTTSSGKEYRGIIGGNQLLAVRYGASTRSIPAQTSPIHIVVLEQ